ncbi:MAG: flagellar hook-length control protein FliK [bacterium]
MADLHQDGASSIPKASPKQMESILGFPTKPLGTERRGNPASRGLPSAEHANPSAELKIPAGILLRPQSVTLSKEMPAAGVSGRPLLETVRKDKATPMSAEVRSPKNSPEMKAAHALSIRASELTANHENKKAQQAQERPENENPWTADSSAQSTGKSSAQETMTQTAASRLPYLSLKVEQLQELRALLDQVLKTSQVLRLDDGHGIHFLWASKEWGPIRFAIRQHAQEIMAKVEVQRPEIQTLLEAHRETLSQIFSEQGLHLDRLEIESPSQAENLLLREVKWDEARRYREQPRAFLDRNPLIPDENLPVESAPEAREVAGRVWIA